MRILTGVVLAALANFAFSSEQVCSIGLIDGGSDYRVFSASGASLGYVSPNSDRTWFVWIEGDGAVNELFADRQSAVRFLCQR